VTHLMRGVGIEGDCGGINRFDASPKNSQVQDVQAAGHQKNSAARGWRPLAASGLDPLVRVGRGGVWGISNRMAAFGTCSVHGVQLSQGENTPFPTENFAWRKAGAYG